MKELLKYEGKTVLLHDSLGDTYTGFVSCFFDKEDNAPDFKESGIAMEKVVKNKGTDKERKVPYPMEFHESEITDIEIVL